jgi:hypothetical protein
MRHTQAHVDQAQRHVLEGAEHIARQEQLIEKLKADGHSTKQAEELLATMRESQRLHEEELTRISAEYAREGIDRSPVRDRGSK